MKKTSFFLILLSFGMLTFAQKDLSRAFTASLKKTIGSDIKGYKVYSLPTNNYGIGTTCFKKWIPKGVMICDMISCYLKEVPSDSSSWNNVNGLAFTSDPGVKIDLDDSINSTYGFQLFLPQVFKTLKINVSATSDNKKGIHITIDSIIKRFLNPETFVSYINKQPPTSNMWKAYHDHRMVVVTGDIVIKGFTVDINKTDSLGAKIDLELNKLLTTSDSLKINKDSLEFLISRSREGSFSISCHKPLVVAVLVKKQGNVLPQEGEKENFEKWEALPEDKITDPTTIDVNK
jgi:hypothetical protein